MTNDEFEKAAREASVAILIENMYDSFLEESDGFITRGFILGAKWAREQCSKENVDIFVDRVTETMERSTEMSILEFRLLVTQKELESERAKSLKYRELLAKFKVLGTDGCNSCETGRITVFYANDKCIQCDPESYRTDTSIEHGAWRDE